MVTTSNALRSVEGTAVVFVSRPAPLTRFSAEGAKCTTFQEVVNQGLRGQASQHEAFDPIGPIELVASLREMLRQELTELGQVYYRVCVNSR